MSIRKNWRTTLLVLLITVTFTSVIGGTMAWFTDTVESSSNVIAAGTLDIDMLVKKGDQYISLEEYPNTQLFGGILWEPGYTAVEYVTIQNKGSLALDYQLNVVPGSDEVKASDGTSLASAIEVYMAFGDTEVTTRDAINDTTKFWYCGTLDELIANEKGFTYGRMLPAVEGEDDAILEPGKVQGSVTCTIVLHMDEDAGNEYQGLTLGSVSLQLMAKQAPVEEDAFDEKYDENAIWPSFESNDYPKANVRLLDPVLDADIYPDGIDDIWYPVTSEGKQTMDWFTKTLKPMIDERYPTLPDREHTYIAGSSMGGLMSLYAVVEYNDVFSRAACLSPSLWVARWQVDSMIQRTKLSPDTVIYMDYGSREMGNHDGMRKLFATITARLMDKQAWVTSRIVPNGDHCEACWEEQIPFFMHILEYCRE